MKQAWAELEGLEKKMSKILESLLNCLKRLLEMSSVAENNRIIPAIDKFDN